MKKGMISHGHRIAEASALFTLGVLLQLGLPGVSGAEPKQGSGGGKCSCMCVANSGVNGGQLVAEVTYDSKGYSCDAFQNQTCNLNNPYTGGVSTGSLIGCSNASSTSAVRGITVLPAGAATIAPMSNPAPKSPTPKVPVTGVKK